MNHDRLHSKTGKMIRTPVFTIFLVCQGFSLLLFNYKTAKHPKGKKQLGQPKRSNCKKRMPMLACASRTARVSYSSLAFSAYFLKLSKIDCHPACCISLLFVSSASNDSMICVSLPWRIKEIFTFLPSPIV